MIRDGGRPHPNLPEAIKPTLSILCTTSKVWFKYLSSTSFVTIQNNQEKTYGGKVFEGLFIFLFFILILVCSV